MTSGPLPAVPAANSKLVWDGENLLIEATIGSTTVTYAYDYLGRLISRGDGTTVTRYLYDGWNRILPENDAGHRLEEKFNQSPAGTRSQAMFHFP